MLFKFKFPIFLSSFSKQLTSFVYVCHPFVSDFFSLQLWYWLILSAILISVVAISDEDALGGPNARIDSENEDWSFLDTERPSLNSVERPSTLAKQSKVDTPFKSDLESASVHNITNTSNPLLRLTPHPCESFILSPPPANKRHTGPRRKSWSLNYMENSILAFWINPKLFHWFSDLSLL